jgi:AAA family ATP:ADP antiporter
MSKTAFIKIKNVLLEQKGEVALVSALFFLATAVFWILKPIKKGVFISHFTENTVDFFGTRLGGAQAEQLAKLSIVLTALLVAYLFSVAVRHFQMRNVFTWTTLLGVIGCVFFSSNLPLADSTFIWAFYIFGDIQNSLILILLWSILHNTFHLKDAKCVFTLVSLSGLLGGLSGTFFVQQTIQYFGRETIILVCAGMLGLIALIGSHYLNRKALPASTPFADDSWDNASGSSKPNENAFDWHSLAKLKYWVAIGLIVALYEMVSGIIDFQLSLTVEKINGSELEKDVYFGYVGTAQNLVALLVQMFLTGYVIRHWGLKTALLVLPLTILLGSVGFLVVPSLAGAMFLAVTDNGLNYSLNQQAKETLYVPARPEERLRAKAFIDLFVQRFAKAAAVGVNLFVVASNGLDAARWLTLVVVPLAILWILVVRFTGREFENLVMNSPN